MSDKRWEIRAEDFAPARACMPAFPAAWMPRADIRETDEQYAIEVALPGVRKEDVRVEITDDVLTVSGRKKAAGEGKGGRWLRRESCCGPFLRSFTLPEGLHTEDVKATCLDGMLTLILRKPPEFKSRGLSIDVE